MLFGSKKFYFDYFIEKVVCTIFDIDFSYPTHLYTYKIISAGLLIHASFKSMLHTILNNDTHQQQ